MKFKTLAIALACAAATSGAFANDVVTGTAVVGNTAFFGVTHFDSAPFTDLITFTFSGVVTASASIVTIDLAPGNNIDFTGAWLGSQALTLSPNGTFETGFITSAGPFNGSVTLKVTGTTDAGNGVFSSYSGTINITPVPEPETYAMMLAGLGALGFLARRRQG